MLITVVYLSSVHLFREGITTCVHASSCVKAVKHVESGPTSRSNFQPMCLLTRRDNIYLTVVSFIHI